MLLSILYLGKSFSCSSSETSFSLFLIVVLLSPHLYCIRPVAAVLAITASLCSQSIIDIFFESKEQEEGREVRSS